MPSVILFLDEENNKFIQRYMIDKGITIKSQAIQCLVTEIRKEQK